MKKAVLLLSALMLFGCGGGGGTTTTSSNTGGGGGNPVGSTTGVTIQLKDAASPSTTASSAHAASLVSSAPVANARVVVRQNTATFHHDPIYASYDDFGNPVGSIIGYDNYYTYEETFRRVVDTTINTSNNTITFATPVSSGPTDLFQFDVLTYIPGSSSTPNTMVKYGSTIAASPVGVQVTSGMNVVITMADVNDGTVINNVQIGGVVYQLPASVKSESPYSLTATTSHPLRSNYDLRVSLPSDITARATNHGYSGSLLNLIAPSSSNNLDTTITFNFTFYITDDMLDKTNSNDVYTKWARKVPSTYSATNETTTTSVPFAYLLSVTL